MNEKEKQKINDFLAKDPEAPSERFTKAALFETAKSQYDLLLLLRKYWLGTIVDGLEGAQVKESTYKLGLVKIANEENGTNWDKIHKECNRVGFDRIINIQWSCPEILIWYIE